MIRKAALLIVAALLINKSASPSLQTITEKPLTESSIQDPRAPKVDALFLDYERGHSPGLAVVVVRDEKVLLRRGYGLASLEHRIRITPSTVFDLASLAKQFTGFAVATLVENGNIRLSDDIRKYVPEIPDFGETITIDNLVHHTSGFRDWPSLLGMAGWNWDDVITFDHVLSLTYRQRSLNFTPGAEFAYSNTGYNLLAEMVARVTGQPFQNWTDDKIFKPLGMANTHFHSDHTEFVPNRASSYRRNPDGSFHFVPDNLTAFGSSSLFSTIDDMAKWLINFDDAKVGGPAVLARMRTLIPLNDGNINRYAFGLINGQYRGLPIIEHTGGWAAYSSYVMHFPKQHFSIFMVANTNAVNLPAAVTKVVDIFLDKELGPPAPWVTESARPAVKVDSDVLKKYVGLYSLSPDLFIRIKQSGSTLTMQKTHSGVSPMTPRSPSE